MNVSQEDLDDFNSPEHELEYYAKRKTKGSEITPGRIVMFVADAHTAFLLNRVANDSGNRILPGDILPALILSHWGSGCCNLTLFPDGPASTYWMPSVAHVEPRGIKGDSVLLTGRTWHWPIRS